MLIDSHCHIDQFSGPEEIVRECEKGGIRVIAVTNLPSDYVVAAERLKNKQFVSPALGMHPLMATKAIREVSNFKRLVQSADYVGEVGLDYSREGVLTKSLQERVFNEVLVGISDRPRFVTLHSRGAEREVLSALNCYGIKRAVFHWFTGPRGALKEIVQAGHLLSINAEMLKSAKGKSIIQLIPKKCLLVETDGPYAKVDGRPTRPLDLSATYRALGELLECSEMELQEIVATNFAGITAAIAERRSN